MKIKTIETHYGGRWFYRIREGERVIWEGYCSYKTPVLAEKQAYEDIALVVQAAKKGIEVEK